MELTQILTYHWSIPAEIEALEHGLLFRSVFNLLSCPLMEWVCTMQTICSVLRSSDGETLEQEAVSHVI